MQLHCIHFITILKCPKCIKSFMRTFVKFPVIFGLLLKMIILWPKHVRDVIVLDQ
jgi:hypothetical protein